MVQELCAAMKNLIYALVVGEELEGALESFAQ